MMNDEQLYDLWRRHRADAEEAPAADFADRVMGAVRREPPPFRGVLSSPAVRVAACALACVACLYRMAAVVAVFFAQ